MRVGFLFNHDQIHQVAHSLPIALALLERRGPVEPILAATSEGLANEVRRLAALAGHEGVEVVELGLATPSSRMLDRLLHGLLPSRKLLVYRDNLAFFRGLDALVVTERTSLILKTRYGLTTLPMILADHGAGDRAIGFGAVTSRFDHILAAGPKIRDRLVADAGVDPRRIAITGYPKFDVPRSADLDLPMLRNGRPTVIYNPHVSPHLSSWFRMGRGVLDFFLASDRYNLIFAPHVMLFQRPWTLSIDRLRLARPGTIDRKYRDAPNIHIDLGSRASTDMSYIDAADIYLGDVSSQVYEFLGIPRPCVFTDVEGVDRHDDPNYAHWQAGPVITRIDQLGDALDESIRDHASIYAPIQRALFDYTFDMTGEPSASRAAREIERIIARRAWAAVAP